MKIFISSTIEDLKEERKKAIETVDGLSEYKAIAMERFVSSPYKSKDVCLKQIQSSDALILILGFKYGTIEKNEGVSFTELEYNEAKDLHLPIFVFIKHNSGDKWIVEESDIERKTKLENFKSRLDSDITWTAFKTPEELSTKIIEAIRNYEYEYGIIGPRLKTFISFEEFFKPFLDETKIFNHNYSLIGRTKILNELDTFIESDKKIALLYGRGGIGKSKILYEFSKTFKEKHPKWLLEFLRNENLSQNSIKELPAEKCVIIIDDAHRLQNQDISIILNLLYKYEKRFKIIFSSRCQGINFIQLSLTLQNFDMKEVTKIPEIKELTQLEMEEFGKEILGEKNLIFLKPLLRIAKDSPLIMIIGGNFIKESKIDPEKLILNVEFQKQILDRFIDELIGKATDQKIAPELCKDILSLISILSKINIKDNLLIERVSYFLNVDQDKLIEAIGVLENTGILLRRGNLLRITPDPLSDHILYKSCIAENGVLTGYGMRVFDKFNDLYFEKILFNLSELDWRLNSDNKGVNLIDDIWAKIIKEFKESSDYYHQKKILEKLERIASFQPDKVLELIKYLLTSNNSNILEILPLLLKGVSYNIDYLPYCCELLWKLGKDDSRPTNLYPNHAVRILFDLAEYQYQYRKPIKFNYKVFESIKGIILKEPDVLDHVNSPIDILAKFLEKETISNEFEGHEFIFKAFGISYKEIKPLRDEVILLLENISKSPKPKIVLKVYEVLNRLLYPPIGAFG